MRHLADQTCRRVARQPRIGVQRDDKANVLRQRVGAAIAGIECATQQAVQLGQLAALAFPAHPDAFGRGPPAVAVQVQKARTGGTGGMGSV